MSNYRFIGLESIAYGTPRAATVAGMTATLTTVEAIVPDSAVLAIATPGKTELMVEDSDWSDIVVSLPGEKTIEFATRDMDPANWALAFGGAAGTTGWRAADTAVVVSNKSIKAVTKSYNGNQVTIDIVNANIRGGGDLRFSKTESGMLTFAIDILRPKQPSTDRAITMLLS